MFEKRNAGWLSELPSVIKQYITTIHNSTKLKPIDASKRSTRKEVYSNLIDDRVKQQTKNKLGQSVRTADDKIVFSKGDSTNWSYILY